MTLVIGEYAMPDPKVVSRAEYTAIHQVLEKQLAGLKREDVLPEAEFVLTEIRTWVDDIQDKLNRVHQSG